LNQNHNLICKNSFILRLPDQPTKQKNVKQRTTSRKRRNENKPKAKSGSITIFHLNQLKKPYTKLEARNHKLQKDGVMTLERGHTEHNLHD
jgi:hypothetical protein